MNEKTLNPNLFLGLDIPEDFNLIVGEPFKRKFYFIYNSSDNQFNGKLYGNPKTTGIETTNLVHEADGKFSVEIYGAPKLVGKNTMTLKLSNQTEYIEFKIIFHVAGLKFLDYSLPDAIGLRKEYTTRIHFYNPSSLKPKFMYSFPIEFGQVKSEIEDEIDYTTISFSPHKAGKYKFHVTALSDKEIEMGSRTLNLEVVDTEPKRVDTFNSAKAVDIKDWK